MTGRFPVQLYHATLGHDFELHAHRFSTEAEALLAALMIAETCPGEFQISDDQGDVLTLTIDDAGRITDMVRGMHLKERRKQRRKRGRSGTEHLIGYQMTDTLAEREEACSVRSGIVARILPGPGSAVNGSVRRR